MDRISVLMVAGELWPFKRDGVSGVVLQLSNALADTGIVDVTVLGSVRRKLSHDRDYWGYRGNVQVITCRTSGIHPVLTYPSLQLQYSRQYLRWHRHAGGDAVVHTHLLPGARTFLLSSVANKRSAPIVYSLHGWPPLEIPWLRAKWKHMANWNLVKLQLSSVKHAIANSSLIASSASQLLKRSRIWVIPHAPDHAVWYPRQYSSDGDRLKFIFWGELYPLKGPEVALLAFAEYLQLTNRRGDTLCVVGGGSDERRLQRLARDLSILTNVSFLGPKPAPELADLVASSDIAILPSGHEGFGLTVFEGLACGKPVITSAKGAPREFLRNGVEVMVAERDKSAIARAMIRLALDEGLRLEIARNGRRRVLQFSWAELARQYLDVYVEVLRAGERAKETVPSL